MRKRINIGTHSRQSLHPCNAKPVIPERISVEHPQRCGAECEMESPNAAKDIYGLLNRIESINANYGQSANLDPMMSGKIVPDPENPDGRVINFYPQGFRGSDQAMEKMFEDMVVIDDDGKAFLVPIIWGTQEDAVAAMLGPNVRDDETQVVTRPRLPMLCIYEADWELDRERYTYHYAWDLGRTIERNWKPGFTLNEDQPRDTVLGFARGIPVNIKYTLTAWTWFLEDMNQIATQVLLKTVPQGYIRVRGVQWEIPVEFDGMGNNLETEPAEGQQRVVKFQFNLTVKTYIPQPIHRRKAVLKAKLDFVNSLKEEELSQVLERLEEVVRTHD